MQIKYPFKVVYQHKPTTRHLYGHAAWMAAKAGRGTVYRHDPYNPRTGFNGSGSWIPVVRYQGLLPSQVDYRTSIYRPHFVS